MKTYILGALVAWSLLSQWATADCHPQCKPRWSAPSPTLDDACHYQTTGIPFATCTCRRAYTSPHILGYGGMGCCYGYQRRSCLCPLGCGAGPRCWAPAYCNGPVECGSGSCPNQGGNIHADSYQVAFSGWENLGQIPNDSAAAAVSQPREEASLSPSPASLLESFRGGLPAP